MSEYQNIPVGKQVQDLDISPMFDAYSGVEIVVDEDTAYFSGNRSGRVLTIENKWGTQAQADSILASLRSTGFQYQPYTATGALINPAAEIGDGVIVNGVHSGIYKLSKNFGPLMVSDIEAPHDEEVDHEYHYESKQDRIYKREIADAKAQISITQNEISAEVLRATEAEGTLSSLVSQTAESINATVSTKLSASGGSASSFGWTLTSSGWELKSNNATVLKATSAGIEIKGKITATSGYIGNGTSGFTITSSAIYNGMSTISNTSNNGIYIGTDGIALGKGAFKVTSAGNVSASNMTLTGTLNVGGASITAASLRQGAERANAGYGGWNSTQSTVSSNSSYWSGGAGGGYLAINAFNDNQAVNYMKARYLTCLNSWFYVGDYSASWKQTTVTRDLIVSRSYNSTLGQYVVSNVSKTDATLFYLGR